MSTTPSATIAFSSEYTPYGSSYALVGMEALIYTGKLLDSATGFYYEGARYYDPTTGRFITEDSVVGSTSDPQSLNRYVYARDNPMKIVDMNGHEWWNPVADISAAVTDVAGAAQDVGNAVSNAWNSLPPVAQAGIIAGVAAVATVGLCLTVIGCLAAPEIDLGAAAAVAGVAGTGAVADAAPSIESSVTSEIIPALSREGVNLVGIASRLSTSNAEGFLGEEYTNAQTGEINNGMLAKILSPVMQIATRLGVIEPDSADTSFGGPPVIGGVKVGTGLGWQEVGQWIDAVQSKTARPGILFFLRSPITGKIGPTPAMEWVLTQVGFSIVKIDGPWWKIP